MMFYKNSDTISVEGHITVFFKLPVISLPVSRYAKIIPYLGADIFYIPMDIYIHFGLKGIRARST